MRASHLSVVTVSAALLLAAGCGPDYLTPDDVRSHLLLPSGSVSQDTVGRVTEGFYGQQDADSIENYAGFLKSSESGGDGAAAWAAGITGSSSAMEDAVAMGAAEDIGDIFCAASLVAAISAFDSCESSDTECDVELTIDACLLRIGEGGDENARGRIVFNLHTERGDEWSRETLSLQFEGFEATNSDGNMDFFAGNIFIESTELPGHEEVIFSADIDTQERSVERGLFDDGIIWRHRVTAAARFTSQEGVDRQATTLEIVVFVDDTDDTRDESVVIQFEAESRQIDENTELAGATLVVRGSNGAFSCTWSSASREGDDGDRSSSSAGECIDEDTGEVFNWTSTSSSTSGDT